MGAVEKFQASRTFIEESWAELQKVTWPDYDQLRNATIVVIVFVIVLSTTIWLMDFTIRTVIDFILRVTGGA